MAAQDSEQPRAQPPDDHEPLELTPPSDVAAGPKAVWTALRRTGREMGLFRGLRVLKQVNQVDGFDCPGCAWPDPDERSSLGEYCENGAKAVAEEATIRRVTPDVFQKWSVTELSNLSDYELGKMGRLTHPMILRHDRQHYEPIRWADAFQVIAEELKNLDSPDEAVFYTSGRTSNEAAFLYQLFVRRFGTNNLPDCSNMCHESSGKGLSQVIGVGKGTVTLDDFEKAEVIIVIGQNPGTNHPRMLTTLARAKKAGSTIVHINPLPEAGLKRFKHPQEIEGWLGRGTPLADPFLQVRINGDVALLKGIMKAMLEAEDEKPGTVLAQDFIQEKTEGFDAFAADLRQESWARIQEESGISKSDIEQTARLPAGTDRIIICWAMGLTQHKNAVANIQSCVNLLLMKGAIGKPGAGACPVRGHSNVQGDRTVGITPQPGAAFLDALQARFNFEPPRTNGYDTVEAIEAMHDGQAKVFVAMGGNFLSATPDTEYTAAALRNCSLTVQVSTKLNRSHVVTGRQALILPCLGRTETDRQAGGLQFVSVENSMGIVHSSRGTLEPASEFLLSEPAIVAGLAEATFGVDDAIPWSELTADYDAVRTHIEATVPGFDNYNKRVRDSGGFYLPNAAREGIFKTQSGLAVFTVHPIPQHRLADGHYLMMTIRSHDQYNTTIYGLDDRYRGIRGNRRVLLMNRVDMEQAGLTEKQVVNLVSHFEGEQRTARHFHVVPFLIPRRCVATYFPEANVLVPVRSTADISNTPTSKSVVISIHPVE